ncbi:MAG: cytochrome c oxidase accessory protein CcoG [Pseudomonadota bacterium]|nr:cytochrome c oxidase accessory protein CcoG [Pseudomonadota bacterium]
MLYARADEVAAEGPLYASAKKVHPQTVSGAFRRLKWRLLWLFLGIYYLLPFVRWDRGPHLPNQAVLIDLDRARFYFFFIKLWPQEVYYFTGLMIVASLALFLSNALIGRAWCGFACPQTIWTDLFVWVEARIEGDRRERIKLDAAPWTSDKIAKRAAKHVVWLAISWWTGGAFVLYFADAPTLVRQLATFHASMTPWISIAILTGTTYFLAGHMREQYCLYMCPWPRIQTALTDEHALNVTYRVDRGEPKMSLKEASKARFAGAPAGDCIDCNQCVSVCPTGVDIRLGLQPGCIQCGLCIDACDAVMTKVKRPTRLIGYDTDDNLRRRSRGQAPVYQPIRSRTLVYAGLIAAIGGVMLYQLMTRQNIALSVMHNGAPMFTTLRDGATRNGYTLKIANKWGEPRNFAISIAGLKDASIKSVGAAAAADGKLIVSVEPDSTRDIDLLVTAPMASLAGRSTPLTVRAVEALSGETAQASDNFFGP